MLLGGSQLLEQRRAADHLPARGLRHDRDASHASQPGAASRVRAVASVDAFVGEHGRLLLTLENSADTARLGIECEVAGSDARAPSTCRPAARRAPMSRCRSRGAAASTVDRIKLSTAFPFGLFRAWTYVHLRRRRARLARAARPARAAARGRERRQRAGRASRRRRGMGGPARIPQRRFAAAGGLGRLRARPRPAGEDLSISGRASSHCSTSPRCPARSRSSASNNCRRGSSPRTRAASATACASRAQRTAARRRQRASRALPRRARAVRQR